MGSCRCHYETARHMRGVIACCLTSFSSAATMSFPTFLTGRSFALQYAYMLLAPAAHSCARCEPGL
jgi:hypothetical protein